MEIGVEERGRVIVTGMVNDDVAVVAELKQARQPGRALIWPCNCYNKHSTLYTLARFGTRLRWW